MRIIKDELNDLKDRFGDARRTQIIEEEINEDFNIEDLIAEEDMIVTISHSGYIKRLAITWYRKQNRGTKGVIGMETKDEDFCEHMFVASTHNYILFFTRLGRCHWLKVHEIPQGGRLAKGKAIVNLIGIEKNDSIAAFVPVRSFDTNEFIILCTKQGQIKKTEIKMFSNPRRDGIIAMTLPKDDGSDRGLTVRWQQRYRHGHAPGAGGAVPREARCAIWAGPLTAYAASPWPRAT